MTVPKSPLQPNEQVSKLRPTISLPVDRSTTLGELGTLATGRGTPAQMAKEGPVNSPPCPESLLGRPG